MKVTLRKLLFPTASVGVAVSLYSLTVANNIVASPTEVERQKIVNGVVKAKDASKTQKKNSKNTTIREVRSHAMHFGFDDVDKLDKFAQLVIIGIPLDDFLEREHIVDRFPDGNLMSFATATAFKVDKILKKPEGFKLDDSQIMSVIEPVGLIDEDRNGKVKILIDEYQELKKGSRYIVYLMKNARGKYSIINMNLGKFNLDGTDVDDLGEEDKPILREEKLKFKKEVFKKYGDGLK